MRTPKLTLLALALAGALPALAAEPTVDARKELDALKARVAELERAGGMTPEQAREFNRIAVKTEALEDGRDASGFKNLKISGWADLGYHYNFNAERGSFQFLVPSSAAAYGYDNSYFGSLALDLLKETDSGVKYHLTLMPARSAGEFIGGAGLVHEASVSIPVEALDGKLFFGQLPDWSGYEYLPPTQNKLITHNLLFDFTLPYTYTGVGLEKPLGKWVLKGMIANVNQSMRSLGEHAPAFVCRGDYTGGEFWGLGFACLAGKKANLAGGKDTTTLTGEVDGWYTRGDVTLNFHVAYGQQDGASITPDPVSDALRKAQWMGGSVLAAYKVTPRAELIVRADYVTSPKNGGGLFDWTAADPTQGIGADPADPEKGVDRYAVTAGLSYAFDPSVVWKLEYRYDGASKKVFGNKVAIQDYLDEAATPSPGAAMKSSNSLVSTSMVFSF